MKRSEEGLTEERYDCPFCNHKGSARYTKFGEAKFVECPVCKATLLPMDQILVEDD